MNNEQKVLLIKNILNHLHECRYPGSKYPVGISWKSYGWCELTRKIMDILNDEPVSFNARNTVGKALKYNPQLWKALKELEKEGENAVERSGEVPIPF